MVVLIELLGKLVSIICNESWRMSSTCLCNLSRESIQDLDDTDLLWREFHVTGENRCIMCKSLCIRLAEDRLDTSMSILNKRTGVTIEIDRLLRIKEHGLARIHLKNEVLKSTKADHLEERILLLSRKIINLSKLHRSLLCSIVHSRNQIISIYNCSLTRLHLTLRKLHHTIRKVVNAVSPIETKLTKNKFKHLEMVVLLVTYDIDMFIEAILCKTLLSSTKILSHIDRSTVTTEKKLSVKTVSSKIAPHRSVLLLLEDITLKTLLHESLTEEVSLRLIICSVKADS